MFVSTSDEQTKENPDRAQCEFLIQIGTSFDTIFDFESIYQYKNLKTLLICNCVIFGELNNKDLELYIMYCGFSEPVINVSSIYIENQFDSIETQEFIAISKQQDMKIQNLTLLKLIQLVQMAEKLKQEWQCELIVGYIERQNLKQEQYQQIINDSQLSDQLKVEIIKQAKDIGSVERACKINAFE